MEENPAIRPLLNRLAQIENHEIAITIVNVEEQMRGWISFIGKKNRKVTEQIQGYARLRKQLRLYCATTILEFDAVAAAQFQSLRKKHPRIGANDLKIAAITIMNNATLVTCNLRHFRDIEGLKVEDWSIQRESP